MLDLEKDSQRKSIEECYKLGKILALTFLVIIPAIVAFANLILMFVDFSAYGTSFFASLVLLGLLYMVFVFVKKQLIVKYGMYKNILEINEEKTNKKNK